MATFIHDSPFHFVPAPYALGVYREKSPVFTDSAAPRARYRNLQWAYMGYYGRSDAPPEMEPMTPKEERALFRRFRKEPAAKEQLVRRYLFLAFKVATKYRGPKLDLEEATGAANAGLMEAFDRFKPGKRIRFSTFAMPFIRRHVCDALVATHALTLSDHFRNKLQRGEFVRPGDRNLGEKPGEVIQVTPKEFFGRMSDASTFDTLAMHERPEDCSSMPAAVAAPDFAALLSASREELAEAFQTVLTDLERTALTGRYLSDPARSFEAIGRSLGASKNSVRVAHDLALVKLRRHFISADAGSEEAA